MLLNPLVHLAAPPKPPPAPTLRRVPLSGTDGDDNDASLGVLVAEDWSAHPIALTDAGRTFTLAGSSRAFLARDEEFAPSTMRSWQEVSYRKLRLLDKKLEFTIDLSNVGCGCNAAAYLVEMGDTSSSVMSSDYCDIQGFDSPDIRPCLSSISSRASQRCRRPAHAARPRSERPMQSGRLQGAAIRSRQQRASIRPERLRANQFRPALPRDGLLLRRVWRMARCGPLSRR